MGKARLNLYIAGEAPDSVEALANIEKLQRNFLQGRCDVQIIDIRKDPQRSLIGGILVTPTLVRQAPLPERRIIGSLREFDKVLAALEL